MQFILFLLGLTILFQNKSLDLSYDKLKNQTTASTAPIEIKLNDDLVTKEFTLKIQYAFNGEVQVVRPVNVNLVFRALSHRWRFLEESSRQATLVIDGVKLSLPSKPAYTSVIGEKYLDETLVYEVKTSDVERLAKASNSEIQIGGVTGKFKERRLTKIKDFLNALPGGGKNG